MMASFLNEHLHEGSFYFSTYCLYLYLRLTNHELGLLKSLRLWQLTSISHELRMGTLQSTPYASL